MDTTDLQAQQDKALWEQAVLLLLLEGQDIPLNDQGMPVLTHTVVGTPAILHLFRLPGHVTEDNKRIGSKRWRGVLGDDGSLQDLTPITTSQRKHLQLSCRASQKLKRKMPTED